MAEILDCGEPTDTMVDRVIRAAQAMPDSRLTRTIPLEELMRFAALLAAGVEGHPYNLPAEARERLSGGHIAKPDEHGVNPSHGTQPKGGA